MSRRITAADCKTCGACCMSSFDSDEYVELTEDDMVRLGKSYIRRNVRLAAGGWAVFPTRAIRTKQKKQRAGPLKGDLVCVCVSLRGSIGSQVSCSIYDRRPEVCVKFRPGSWSCRDARHGLIRVSVLSTSL